jgi:hypothetical protein
MRGYMETINKEKYRKMKKNILLPFILVGIVCLFGSCDKEDEYFDQDDYEISNGVLLRYRGMGGNVVISKKLGITIIEVEAFAFEKYVTSVKIPDGVIRIDSAAFFACRNLTSVSMPKSLTFIGNRAFEDCTALASVEIPSSVKSVGNDAFSHCISLTAVEIPEGVTTIGRGAFVSCISLTTIEIPASVTSFGSYAFGSCMNLKTVKVGWKRPPVQNKNGDDWFTNIGNATLIVPPGTKALYENDKYWGNFGKIVESN